MSESFWVLSGAYDKGLDGAPIAQTKLLAKRPYTGQNKDKSLNINVMSVALLFLKS
jgi:hypothetical protein